MLTTCESRDEYEYRVSTLHSTSVNHPCQHFFRFMSFENKNNGIGTNIRILIIKLQTKF